MSMMIIILRPYPCAVPCLALPTCLVFFSLIITVTDGLALFTFLLFAFPPSELHEKVHD